MQGSKMLDDTAEWDQVAFSKPLDLNWSSLESGDLWCKSGGSKSRIAPTLRAGGGLNGGGLAGFQNVGRHGRMAETDPTRSTPPHRLCRHVQEGQSL